MLVLSRKADQKILIGDAIVLTVVRIDGHTVRLGIEAPADVVIVRDELIPLRRASTDAPGEAAGAPETA